MALSDQDLLKGIASGELDFVGELNKQHFGLRRSLRELVDKLDPDTEVIMILKRPADHSIAYKTFGIDARDATYMLAQTKQRILSSQPS